MVWGNPANEGERWQARMLSPLGTLYGLANWLHRNYHRAASSKRRALEVPVLSVGNITCGGTGKTPVVISLAQYFQTQSLKVAVVSRGYKRHSRELITTVSDGTGHFATCHESGDEPMLIAKMVPEAVVLSSTNRQAACHQAIAKHGCEIVLLDDAFQHYRMSRDADIVLIDYNDEPEKDSLLPAGRLREPLSQLKRAQHIVITKLPQAPNEAKLERLRRTISAYAPSASIASCRFTPRGLRANGNSAVTTCDLIRNRKVAMFCGLANPSGFASMLADLGAEIVATKNYPDHHWYTEFDIATLNDWQKSVGAEFLITTGKDAVKLEESAPQLPFQALEIETQWVGGLPQFLHEWGQKRNVELQTPTLTANTNSHPNQ